MINRDSFLKKYLKPVSAFLFIVYVCYLGYLVFFSSDYYRGNVEREIHYIPFGTIMHFLFRVPSKKVMVINVFGNIVAFVPMGFLLPIIKRKSASFKNTMLIVFFATCTVEITQYIAGVGVTDIDDIVLNFLGGVIGYVMYCAVYRLSMFFCPKTEE